MTNNPYEPPSPAVLEEAQRAKMVLDPSEISVVRRFLLLNRLVAFCLLGIGIISILAPIVISLRVRSHPLGILFTATFGFVVAFWGFLQLKRNIAAISFTATVMVLWFVLVTIPGIHALLVGNVPPGPRPPVTAILSGLAFAAGLTWALVYVPVWLAVRAWLWRQRGIDLAKLEKIEYRQVDHHLEASREHQQGGP